MRFTKIRLTKDASNRLRFLAGRTGLTPNLLVSDGILPLPRGHQDSESERVCGGREGIQPIYAPW